MKSLLFALLLFLALASSAQANTYWVSPTGNDGNQHCFNSTSSPALANTSRTIAQGKGCLGPSDTLIIKAGTYAEAIAGYTAPGTDGHGIPWGTSWNAPTIIKAEVARTVTLTGQQDGNVLALAPTVGGSCPASLCTAKYVIFDGLIFDGTNSSAPSVVRLFQSHIKIINGEIKNAAVAGSCMLTGPGPDTDVAVTGDDVFIQNNLIHDCGADTGGGFHGLYFASSYSLIEGNDIYNITNGYAIQLQYKYAHHVTVRKNKLHNSRNGLVISSFTAADSDPPAAHDNLVYNNVIYNNTDVGIAISYGGAQSANNNTVVGNSLYGHGYAGIRTFGGTGNIIRNNVIGNSTRNFLVEAGSFTATNNFCSITGGVCVGTAIPTPQDSTLIFTNIGTYDLTLRAGSNAINNGLNIGSPYDTDYLNASRGATWDIGAYEFGGVVPTAPTVVIDQPTSPNCVGTDAACTISGVVGNANNILNLTGTSSFGAPPAQIIGEAGSWTTLDSFATAQLNGESNRLFDIYTGEDPNQVVNVYPGTAAQIFTITAGTGGDNGIYWHFLPRGNNGYNSPNGYMKHYITGTAPASWANVNRLQFLVRPTASQARSATGSDNMQVGTYIRSTSSSDANNQGQHYYHLFDPNWIANRWHLVILNRQPQHQVGGSGSTNWPLDPEFGAGSENIHYYDGLTRWYFDTQFNTAGNVWSFKGPTLGTISSSVEDNEISSVIIVYTGTRYEVSWAARKNVARTFDIRYSTVASMKLSGFTSGTSGGTATNPGSDYTGTFWASPNMNEANPGIWIAIRRQGATGFSEYWVPFNMGQ